MSENTYAIKVEHVSKTFALPHERHASIKGNLIAMVGGRRNLYERQQVLSEISFEIKKGEFFGIVGRNGSGKSTLLKLLAGIYTPDKGSITVNGKLTPFIELGVGFNPELTGRENVFLNGALLGFSRKDMLAMYDDIVEFAELERFMDQKLKNYSSGMQVRLAFSIAIRAETDILLIDEVLAVGDAAFQRKCFDYFMLLKKNKKTVILVTHDMSAARQYCDRGIMIDEGKIVESGGSEKIAQSYQRMFNKELSSVSGVVADDETKRWGTGKLRVQSVGINVHNDKVHLNCIFQAFADIAPPVFGFTIYNSRGMNVVEGNTKRMQVKTRSLKAGESASISWSMPNILGTDTYMISVACCNDGVTEFYDWLNEAATFVVQKQGDTAAIVDPALDIEELTYQGKK